MELQRNNNNLPELLNISNSITAINLQENNFGAIVESSGNDIRKVLDRPAIAMLSKIVDKIKVEIFLAQQLQQLKESVNIDARLNLQAFQIPFIAKELVDMFPLESLEDFVICFKRGSFGWYGQIYRLDAAVIVDWFSRYLEEKYTLVESGVKEASKDEEKMQVDYEAFKKKIALKAKEQENRTKSELELKIRRFVDKADAVNYQTPAEVAQKKALHIQYIRENYDPITSKPLPTWKEESDWISERL
jgi:hypothetical protein